MAVGDDSLARRFTRQKAMYWAPLGAGPDGQPTYATPVEITVRWDIKNEVYRNKAGNEVVSNAVVMVDRPVLEEGFLWRGTEDELDALLATLPDGDATSPINVPGAQLVQARTEVGNRQVTKFFRTAIL